MPVYISVLLTLVADVPTRSALRASSSMEQTVDRAEAAAVDHYFLSSTENISVPVWLRTPGNRLMIVL